MELNKILIIYIYLRYYIQLEFHQLGNSLCESNLFKIIFHIT